MALNENEKREVARRVAKRLRDENVRADVFERRAKDVTAEELTKFYKEQASGTIRWTTTAETISKRVRIRTAVALRMIASWLER